MTNTEIAQLNSKFDQLFQGINDIRSEMATKGQVVQLQHDVDVIKVVVNRLDRHTDEDIRATIKDVEKIKLI